MIEQTCPTAGTRVFRLFIAALAIGSAIASADGQPDTAPAEHPGAPALQLVEMHLNGRALTDFQDVLQGADGALWLPLAALMQAAEAELKISPTGVHEVNLGSVGLRLRIDPRQRRLIVNDRAQEWPAEAIVLQADQLFMANELMASLLDMTARLSSDGLSVDVESSRPLPADLRRLRENRWRLAGQNTALTAAAYHRVAMPYQLWGTPRGDLQLALTGQGAGSGMQASASGAVTLEAGYLTNQFFFTADDAGALRSLRWTAGRSSPAGNAFGVDGLHRLELGDVTPFTLPLQGASATGRGIAFSTAPLDRPELFDVTRLEGDALPGWNAELYRGAELVDFQRIGADGRYRFADVPLIFGDNVFRVVLYGPQGEVREQRFARSITGGQLVPGELHLRGSLVQTQRPLVPIEPIHQPAGEQLTLRADYGLLPRLTTSVFLGLDQQREVDPAPGNPTGPSASAGSESATLHQRNIGVALRPAVGPFTSELVLVKQDGDGSALQLSTWATLGSLYVSGRQQHYRDDFISRERQMLGRQLDNSLRLRLGHAIGNWGSLSLDYERLDFSANAQRKTVTVGLRHRLGPISLAHEITQYREEGFQGEDYRLLGSHRQGALSSRFQLHANDSDGGAMDIRSLRGSLDWQLTPQHFIGAGFGHDRMDNRFNLQLRSGWQFVVGRLSFTVSLDDSQLWAAGLSLSLGIGIEPQRGLSLMPPGGTSGGAVSVEVFHDRDANGEFNAQQDVANKSVNFLVDGRKHPSVTDRHGRTVLRHLPTRRPVRIALDTASLGDPFMVPTRPRTLLQPRPGQTQHLSFALRDSALVTGYVVHDGGGIAGLTVIATNDNGLAIETTRTLSDGYFSFETIAPGTWLLGVKDDALVKDWVTTELQLTVDEGGISEGHILQVLSPASDQQQSDS